MDFCIIFTFIPCFVHFYNSRSLFVPNTNLGNLHVYDKNVLTFLYYVLYFD